MNDINYTIRFAVHQESSRQMDTLTREDFFNGITYFSKVKSVSF